MINVTFDSVRANRLIKELESISLNAGKELGTVSHKAGAFTEKAIAKEVASEIAIKQKDVKRHTYVRKLRPAGAVVTVEKTNRIPLKRFKPRQTKAGVTYRIKKTGKRELIPGAFMGPRPGLSTVKFYGHPFIRKTKTRLPIAKVSGGPSVAGVMTSRGPARAKKIIQMARKRLRYEMVRRIRFRRLKLAGKI